MKKIKQQQSQYIVGMHVWKKKCPFSLRDRSPKNWNSVIIYSLIWEDVLKNVGNQTSIVFFLYYGSQ